jgi:hypothetical protein
MQFRSCGHGRSRRVFPVGTHFEYDDRGATVRYSNGSIVWISGLKPGNVITEEELLNRERLQIAKQLERQKRKERAEWVINHPYVPDTPEDRKARRERVFDEISKVISAEVVDGGVNYALRTNSGKTVAVWTSWDKARQELRRRVQSNEVLGNRDFVIIAEVANEEETPTKFWVMTNGEMQRLANLEGDSSNIEEPPAEFRDRWYLLQ